MLRSSFCTIAALVFFAASPASAATFSFDAYAPTNAQVPLSIAANGLTARFSSPAGAGAFIAEDGSAFSTLGSSVLANDNFTPEELDIGFSQTLNRIAFNFATNDNGSPTAVTLTATLNGVRVGDVSVTGMVAASGLPEGTILLTNAAFDAVQITDTTTADAGFAIGAVTAQVPEPSALLVITSALLGLTVLRRRS